MSFALHHCPLCLQSCIEDDRLTFGHRQFYLCDQCHLLSVFTASLPTIQDEKERYMHHQNTEEDQGYVQFLMQVVEPLMGLSPSGSLGLDYGCGPNPVLAKVLHKAGYECDYYDPLFYPHLKNKAYDFITATECFEHFHRPGDEIKNILDHLKTGGMLAIMTKTWTTIDRLAAWYYLRDFTHVSLYHHETMHWLCEEFGLEMVYSDQLRVYVFRKG